MSSVISQVSVAIKKKKSKLLAVLKSWYTKDIVFAEMQSGAKGGGFGSTCDDFGNWLLEDEGCV